MDADTLEHEHILPVPDVIELYDLDRRKMDEYVDAFDATQHGYRIRIGNWNAGSHLCHYKCYRSGFPPGKAEATKSLRIGCKFRLNARFLPSRNCWILIHTHLGHNHPADSKVPRRKKALATDPILPRPYHLTLNTQQIDQKSPPPEATNPSLNGPTITSINLEHSSESIDSTLSRLRTRLEAMTPPQRQEAILTIDSMFCEQRTSPSIPKVHYSTEDQPIRCFKDEPSNSPEKFKPFSLVSNFQSL